ncbi:Peptidylamidoglycolate lyase [Aphelenchoides fujianensis]|nr:Peptidylamidoglycolate lyase [Aphelenchoides fujianensis]
MAATGLVFGLLLVNVLAVNALPFYGLPPQKVPAEQQKAEQQPAIPETAFADQIPNVWDQSMFSEPLVDVDDDQQPEQPEQAAPVEQAAEEQQDEPSEDFYVPTRIGQAAGVAVDGQNRLVIFHRAGREWQESSFNPSTNVFTQDVLQNNTITVIDPETGKLLGEHGAGLFFMPHGLSVDSEGNYWTTDVGRHQLGERMVPGSDEAHFCKPTDVAVSKSGEIFVADGYCNSRIVKFDRNGKFLGAFGQPNSGDQPKEGEFFVPHSIALIEDLNLLCVADRDNQRIQCFTAGLTQKGEHKRATTPMGTFVTGASNIGRLMALREKHHYLVGVTNADPNAGNDFSVFVMDMNSGKANTFARGIPDAHALALSDSGEIFVSQLGPSQVLKFSIPQPNEADIPQTLPVDSETAGGQQPADVQLEQQQPQEEQKMM